MHPWFCSQIPTLQVQELLVLGTWQLLREAAPFNDITRDSAALTLHPKVLHNMRGALASLLSPFSL